jgi:hypothetical protein
MWSEFGSNPGRCGGKPQALPQRPQNDVSCTTPSPLSCLSHSVPFMLEISECEGSRIMTTRSSREGSFQRPKHLPTLSYSHFLFALSPGFRELERERHDQTHIFHARYLPRDWASLKCACCVLPGWIPARVTKAMGPLFSDTISSAEHVGLVKRCFFWYITPCVTLEVNRRFEGIDRHHLQSQKYEPSN